MNQQAHIVAENKEGVFTLTFNRVDKKNAITAEMYQLLADGMMQANQDESVKIIKIVGSENAFCAGNDLVDFLENPPNESDSPVWQFLAALCDSEKPIIAGVNGPAVGIGTTLLLHCDLVVASSTAIFAMPFVSLGLCPEAASSLLLPQQVGLKKASEWLLLGSRFDAQQANEAGLINYAVDTPEDVDAMLDKWCQQLCKLPAESISVTRKFLRSQDLSAVKNRMQEEGDEFKRLLKSDAAQSAFQAFLKRS
ncbi:MAG: enoyl-CoA hydratase [Gammaproteobacteria bacterium]|nr:enoyl-CoA hydratase [Gammaproteobacteria bacterium]